MNGKIPRLAYGPVLRRWFLAVVVLVATLGAGRIQAEDVDAIVARGIDLRRQGHDSEALAEFQRAMKIRTAPRIQAQIALAEQALGLWTAAEDDLVEALAQNGDSWIRKNRSTLTKALGTIQTHLGTLEVWGTPVGSAIFVNEKPAGVLPLKKAMRVSGESVVLRARADGYLEATRVVRVSAGRTVREHVELVPSPAAPVPERTRREPAVAGAVESPVASSGDTRDARAGTLSSASPSSPSGPSLKDQSPDATSSSRTLQPWAWVAGAGAVGGLALGVVETFVAINKKNAFDNHTSPDPADPSHPIKDCGTAALSAACKPLQDQYNRSVMLEIVGYSVGSVLAVGSVVLFVLSSTDGDHRNTALACLPDPTARGMSCSFKF